MKLSVWLICAWLASQMFFWGANSPGIGIAFFDEIRIDRILFVMIVVIYAYRRASGKIRPEKLEKPEIFMILFTALCTVSLILSGANAEDLSGGKNRWVNALFNITFFPFMAYFIVKDVGYDKRGVNRFFAGLCLIGGYLSLTGVFEHFRIDALIWPQAIIDPSKGTHWERARGPLLDAVAMGRILTIAFLAFLFMIWQHRGFKRMILYLLATLGIVSIYFTYTRGPWVGFGSALLVMLIFRNRMRRTILLFLVIMLLCFTVGVASKFSMFTDTLLSQRQNTVSDRMVSYLVTFKMAKDHPILGIGFGRFGLEWDNYFSVLEYPTFGGFDGSHNTFLTMFAEIGLSGLVIYCSILYLLIRRCWRIYRRVRGRSEFEGSLVVVTLAAAAMYLTSGIFSDLRWTLLPNNLMFILFGLVSGLDMGSEGTESLPSDTAK